MSELITARCTAGGALIDNILDGQNEKPDQHTRDGEHGLRVLVQHRIRVRAPRDAAAKISTPTKAPEPEAEDMNDAIPF
jgi:hypothetical protein